MRDIAPENMWKALIVAGGMIDGIGDFDIHEKAYEVWLRSHSHTSDVDVTDEDYAEAFVEIALAVEDSHAQE